MLTGHVESVSGTLRYLPQYESDNRYVCVCVCVGVLARMWACARVSVCARVCVCVNGWEDRRSTHAQSLWQLRS